MYEITMIDYLACRLEIPRMELKNAAYLLDILNELLVMPDGLYSIKEWNITVSYLYRDHYYFSSIERAKSFVREEIDKHQPREGISCMARRILRTWLLPAVCGLTVLFLMQYVFMICFVPSASMEPTIEEGSFIFATRFYWDLDVGDIVVFEKDGTLLVKRIAAVAGDTIYLDNETGVYSLMPLDESTGALTVPAGCFFVLGDNEENSLDSRFWEEPFVTFDMILARV